MNTDPKPKRKYVGYLVVRNAVLASLDSDGTSRLTAKEIARVHAVNPRSVRMAASYLGVTLRRDPNWGGYREPVRTTSSC